jgi:Lon protease-like protein
VALAEVIPLFPLPNVVLFPYMPLPLHIFEPRYRAMVRDALAGPRLVGMVLLRGDWKSEYEARPPIYTTGTVGQIVHVDELADGRFNIVLRGSREFTIAEELPPRTLYREARVRWRGEASDTLATGAREGILSLVDRYLSRVGRTPTSPRALDRDVDGAAFVNFFAQHLDLEPVEKQALLEESTITGRGRRLAEVLEFRLLEMTTAGTGPQGRPQ